MADGAKSRRLRSDSQRNRSGILDAAERSFAEQGVSASLEGVARDAGVGSATLYRHFPTREALLAELLDRRSEHVAAEQVRIDRLDDTAQALEQWMLALEEFFGAFDGLPGPLRAAFLEEHNPLATTCVGFIDRTDHYLRAAQRAGRVRDDVRGRDLFVAALALSWARGSSMADESTAEQLRSLVRDGFVSPTAGG